MRNAPSRRGTRTGRISHLGRSLSVESLEERALLAVIAVTSTDDSGDGSLRQAILDSNASVGVADTIQFNVDGGGVQTIRPLSPLPEITDPVGVDGTTQPGFPGTPAAWIVSPAPAPPGGVTR